MTCWAKFPQYLDPGYNRLIFKWCGDMSPESLDKCLNNPAVLTPVGCKHCGFHEEESCLQYLFWYFMDRWQHNSLMCVHRATLCTEHSARGRLCFHGRGFNVCRKSVGAAV